MLHQTKGIVLHHFRYSETSIIARIYTEKFGLQSYLIKGVRRPGSTLRISLFEHLSLLDMVVYHKDSRELQAIREAQLLYQFRSIHSDLRKSSQALFMNEIIVKTIKEQESNLTLFEYLYDSVLILDDPETFSAHFHLWFMVQLASHLGFGPRKNYSAGDCFNLREGRFVPASPGHGQFLEPRQAAILNELLCNGRHPKISILFDSNDRKIILLKLIEFYQLHVPSFSGLQSPAVLHEVLSE